MSWAATNNAEFTRGKTAHYSSEDLEVILVPGEIVQSEGCDDVQIVESCTVRLPPIQWLMNPRELLRQIHKDNWSHLSVFVVYVALLETSIGCEVYHACMKTGHFCFPHDSRHGSTGKARENQEFKHLELNTLSWHELSRGGFL